MNTVLSKRLVRRSFTFGARSSGCIWVLFRQVRPSRVTATRIASLLSAACMGMGFLVLTMLTWTPLDNRGVMTMKMISSTNMTSTMGVTLMSETGWLSLAFLNSIFIGFLHGTRQERGDLASLPLKNQLAGFRQHVAHCPLYLRAPALRCVRFRK